MYLAAHFIAVITQLNFTIMTWIEYQQEFEKILNEEPPTGVYAEENMLNYTKLNEARQSRWLKKAELMPELVEYLRKVRRAQHWILITEPWCGDASHIVPIIHLMFKETTNVNFDIELRDTNSEIEKYLTNGSKAIPIFIVRDEEGKDLFHWGPRPAAAQLLYNTMKEDKMAMEDMKIGLQQWYNTDKAVSLQQELLEQFQNVEKR